MSKQVFDKLKEIVKIKDSYDLLLVSIDEKADIETTLKTNGINQIPVLIKHGKEYFIFGYSVIGERQLIELDAKKCRRLKRKFTKLSTSILPTSPIKPNLLKADQVPPALYAEITAKKGHFPNGIYFVLQNFYKLDEKGQLYYSMGNELKADLGLTTVLKDFERDLVITNKTYKLYIMWQEWLLNLTHQDARSLTPLDQEARGYVRKSYNKDKPISQQQGHVHFDLSIFRLFLRRELNLSKDDVEILGENYIQGAVTCLRASNFLLGAILLQHDLLSDVVYNSNTKPVSYRHFALGGQYRVNNLGGGALTFKAKESTEDFDIRSKLGSSGTGRLTQEGYEITSVGANLTFIEKTLRSSEEIKSEIASDPQKFCTDLVKEMDAESKNHQEHFAKALEELKGCETNNPTIQAMQRYAQAISETPDVILPDFTDAIEKMVSFARGESAISTEVHSLATKYYSLLMLSEMDQIGETIYKFSSEEKDPNVKYQLGNILFLQIDKIANASNPIRYDLIEVIRATHQKIHEIFDDKNAFLVAWFTENMQVNSKDLPELKEIQSLFNDMKKYHIDSLKKSAVNQEPKFGVADIIEGTHPNSVEILLQKIINYELNKKIQQLQVIGNKIESFQPVKNDTIAPSPSEEEQIDELPPPPYELNDESPPPYEFSLVTPSGASIPLFTKEKEKEEDLPPAYRPSQPDSKRPSKNKPDASSRKETKISADPPSIAKPVEQTKIPENTKDWEAFFGVLQVKRNVTPPNTIETKLISPVETKTFEPRKKKQETHLKKKTKEEKESKLPKELIKSNPKDIDTAVRFIQRNLTFFAAHFLSEEKEHKLSSDISFINNSFRDMRAIEEADKLLFNAALQGLRENGNPQTLKDLLAKKPKLLQAIFPIQKAPMFLWYQQTGEKLDLLPKEKVQDK